MNEDEQFNLAGSKYDSGDKPGAREMLLEILARTPTHADSCNLLGIIHHESGDAKAAAEYFKRASAANPSRVDYFHNLATACCQLSRRGEALAAFIRAAELAGNEPEQLSHIARSMHDARFYLQSLACAQQVLRMRPGDPGTMLLAGSALTEMGEYSQAIELYNRVLSREPNSVGGHWNLALALLTTGNFREGWREFEWRQMFDEGPAGRRFSTPQWDGTPIPNGTLLLRAEGGFGDVLHYVRYLPMAAERAKRVVVECQPELIPLFGHYAGIAEFVPRGQGLPPFDEHIYLPSLPRVFWTDLTNIPAKVPYVTVPGDRLAAWRSKVPQDGMKNVGLVWSGHLEGRRLDKRSNSVELFAPLATIHGVQFFSLQVGPASSQPRPWRMDIVDYTANIRDFADTAALVSHLDLVICVDTSVAHLAGALAKPVWVLVPFVPDYRWLLGRTDSPWYPTMRLFRQSAIDDWVTPFAQVAEALQRWVG
jgi:Flp pilus assembly protein TadD